MDRAEGDVRRSPVISIAEYNRGWARGERDPVCVVIGGAAGTGKSTVLDAIAGRFALGTVVSTATIRAILRSVIDRETNPYLFEQSYTVHRLSGLAGVLPAYRRQCEPVLAAVDRLVGFSTVERQHHFIEGAHIHPRDVPWPTGVHVVELYLHVADLDRYRMMLSGPTHQRRIGDEDFAACLQIQDFMVREAARLGKTTLDVTAPGFDDALLRCVADNLG